MGKLDQENIDSLQDKLDILRAEEKSRQALEVALENEWWGDSLIEDHDAALATAVLVHAPDENLHYRLIGPLRRGEEPNFLRPPALELLKTIGSLWEEELEKDDQNVSQYRLSVTSLFRTREWQRQRVQSGIHVAEFGPHEVGVAIDFDPNGYYRGEQREPINRHSPDYNPLITSALLKVLVDMENKNEIHLIKEKGYEIEEGRIREYLYCYHVCMRPEFLKQSTGE